MNILVVRLSAIGDCTLVLPVIRAILEQKPEVTLTWLIGNDAYQLLKDSTHPRLRFIAVDKPKSIKDYRAIKSKLSETFDVLLAMQASTRANLIYPMVKARRKIGFDNTRARELHWLFTNETIDFKNEHLHDSFCQFAQKLGVKTTDLDWSIVLSESHQAFKLPQRYIAINPAASKLERSWPAQRYAELIEYSVKQLNLSIVLTGGPANFEQELAREIARRCSTEVINLVGKTSLQQLAAILGNALLCIAPDTGPAHIANAMGTPVIGLYAVAPSRLSGPYLSRELTIDKFEFAVQALMKKDPKQVPWRTRVHDRRAMELITVSEVIAKIKQVFANLQSF
ncbi:glycosyltransferase family 9 protein [Kangiella japonica]|uniref:Glycosyltransferase family 9 protein n=2 Tax=Kangiella japonica TaxID=647384 RepID=A0ABN0SY65_9GAMM